MRYLARYITKNCEYNDNNHYPSCIQKLCQLFSCLVFNTCQKVNTASYAQNFLDRLQTIIKTKYCYIQNRSWELVLYRHPTIFTKVQIWGMCKYVLRDCKLFLNFLQRMLTSTFYIKKCMKSHSDTLKAAEVPHTNKNVHNTWRVANIEYDRDFC